MSVARIFTLEEANALVPTLARALLRTTQMLTRLRAAVRTLADEGFAPTAPGHLPEESELGERSDLVRDLRLARLLRDTIGDEVRALEARGVVVRDIERGLVDFRSVLNGEREVWLCWHLGEREIRFFHDLDAGFAARQPVDGHRFFRSRQLRAPSD